MLFAEMGDRGDSGLWLEKVTLSCSALRTRWKDFWSRETKKNAKVGAKSDALKRRREGGGGVRRMRLRRNFSSLQ